MEVTFLKLELQKIHIKDIQFGNDTRVDNGVLSINKEQLIALLKEDSRITEIKVDLARPGENVRIIPVLIWCLMRFSLPLTCWTK